MSVHDSVPQHRVQIDLGTGLQTLPGVAWSVSRALSGSGLPGQARAVSGSSVATGTLTVVDGRTPWTAQAIAAGGAVRIDAALDAHLPLTRVATMRARSLDAAGARAVDRSLSIEDDLAGLLAPMTVPARIPSAPVDLSTVITDLATTLGLPSDVQPSGVLVPAILPEGRTGWEVCQWVASVTLGACWLSEAGVLTYRGPAAMRGQGTPRETIHTLPQVVDLPWSQGTDDVADRVTLTYTPITVERVSDYSLTVWESTERLEVAAGATVVVEQDLETAVDALAPWLPVWSTAAPEGQRSRWAASTQPDGGGESPADTALTVTSTLVTATRVRITITNTTTSTLYVGGGQPTQLLTLRANVRASRAAQVTLAAGADEAAARATLAVDMGTGITDETAGRTLLGWLAAQTASPRATLSQIQVVPDLGRRLGDLVQVVDPITGLSSRCIISGIHLAAQAGSLTQALDLVLVDGVAPSPPTVVPVVTGSAGTSSSAGISAVEQARRDEADRTDVSQPSVPSAPVLGARLGVLSITWDGLSNLGGAVSSNFSHVEVALGSATGPTTVVDRIERGGGTVHVTGLPYSALRYVRLRGVSRNGVTSAWGAERSQAVTPLVNADLIGKVITEANLGDNTVTARTIVAGAVTTPALAALAVTADKVAANAITADKVAAGEINGVHIAGHSIRAAHVLIGDAGSNVVPNGAGEAGDNSGWGNLTWDTDAPGGLPGSLRSAPGQGTINLRAVTNPSGWAAVQPGTEYLVEVWVRADKPDSVLYIEWRDQAGSHVITSSRAADDGGAYPAGTPYIVGPLTVPTTWTRYSKIVTTNPSASQARLASIYFNHSAGTERGAQVWIAGLRIRPRTPGSLIVDGGITTRTLAAGAITADKIAAGAITAGKIAAGAITAEVLDVLSSDHAAGVPAVRISGAGVRLYDPEGTEVVSLTASGGQYLTLRNSAGEPAATIDDTGGAAFETLTVAGETRVDGVLIIGGDPIAAHGSGDYGPVINGRDLLGRTFVEYVEEHPNISDGNAWMTGLSHGQVVNAWRSEGSTNLPINATSGEYYIMRLQTTHEFISGRIYEIAYLTPHFRCLTNLSTSNNGFAAVLRYTTGSTALGANTGGVIAGTRRYGPASGSSHALGGTTTVRCPEDIPAGQVTIGISFYVYSGRTAESVETSDQNRWEIAIRDGGMRRTANQGVAVNLTASTTPPAPPPPAVKQYTTTWNTSWGESYNGAGGINGGMSGKLAQGRTPYAASQGVMRSLAGFPSMTGTLSGATIVKIEVYVYAAHWHANSGGTLCIGVHGHTSKPTTWSSSVNDIKRQALKKPEGRWITLPSSVHAGFKSGAYRGVSFLPPGSSTSTEYYGYLTASKTKIRVTYKK